MVRPNLVKRSLKEGNLVVGTMIAEFRSPGLAQMMANAGFDFMSIDTEHSRFSLETVAEHVLAARGAGIGSIVRVPQKGIPHLLSRPLDMGVQGLIIPQVETREDVELIIRATKYAPVGMRGVALRRPFADYGKGDAVETTRAANEETLIVIQAESRTAVENLDRTLDGGPVDVVMVGPGDLSQSLGITGQMDHLEQVAHIQRVVDICSKRGVASGIALGNPAAIRRWVDAGMRFIIASTDINIFTDGAEQRVKAIRKE